MSLSAQLDFYAHAFYTYCSISDTLQTDPQRPCINSSHKPPHYYFSGSPSGFLECRRTGGGGLGVGFRQLPYRDLCLTSHLTPTTPPRAGALGSLLEPWLNPRFPSQHNTLIFMEIWRGTFQTHYQRFVHNQGSAEFYARQSSQQISTFRQLHYGFFFPLSLSLSLSLSALTLFNQSSCEKINCTHAIAVWNWFIMAFKWWLYHCILALVERGKPDNCRRTKHRLHAKQRRL